jgi:hypothetical protein
MRQLTLVAHYGGKPPALAALAAAPQQAVADVLGDRFDPYEPAQVHATIVGLERDPEPPGANLNYRRYHDRQRVMDLEGWIDHLKRTHLLPFDVQIGGFARDARPFESRGQTPFTRSFVVAGTVPLAIGWPVTGGERYPGTLDRLRRHAEQYNILHAYHRQPGDVDNDFYFRLGSLTAFLEPREQDELEDSVRELLASSGPTRVPVRLRDLHLVAYDDETLPPETTRSLPLSEPRAALVAFARDAQAEP